MSQETEPPDIPYADWAPTKETLHLYVQLVGKVRLASTHPRNHWWHVPLYVDVRGLTTRQMRLGATSFDLSFDFLDHLLVLRTDRGESASFALEDGLSVAEFDGSLRRLLDEHGLSVAITRQPFGLKTNLPFPEDREHSSYDADAVTRYWRALHWVDDVLDEFASWFSGKASPVHLFWHSLDLAYTRFSGRPALPPADLDPVTREAYSHEVISVGFWAGDDAQPHPSFYSYTAPEPPALTTHELAPVQAEWQKGPTGSLALLPYDVVRASPDPRSMLLGFLQSAYEAGAAAAEWDTAALASSFAPKRPG